MNVRTKPRMIYLAEGNYVLAKDLKAALNDEKLIAECMAMLRVGKNMGDKPAQMTRCMIGYFIATQAGDVVRLAEPAATEMHKAVEAVDKVDLVSLATLLEFVMGAKAQALNAGQYLAAVNAAIAGLAQLREEHVNPTPA